MELASICLAREQGTGAGPSEKGDLIRPTEVSPGDTYFVSSRLRLRELGLEEAVLSARLFPRGERTETGRPMVVF